MSDSPSHFIPEYYRIIVEGHLNRNWTDWFEGLKIDYEGGNTVFTGQVLDQAALHGLFNRIRDLNLTLLKVERISPTQDE